MRCRGLDWFSFFLADIQTGFGPFVAIYLTAHAWTQSEIGLVLTVGGLVALVGQMPGGLAVDMIRARRLLAGLAVIAICLSSLVLAIWPIYPIVLAGRVLHAAASCIVGPALAAISLDVVGHAALGERIGRNARFASIGNGVAALAMGACGHLFSDRAIFVLAALLVLPALLALRGVRPQAAGPTVRREARPRGEALAISALLRDSRLLIFGLCVLLFHLANAAMLPLVAGAAAIEESRWATALVAACMVVPQGVVALICPQVGRWAQSWGRRPLLLCCFAALTLRGILFALTADPYAVVAIQALDGICAAVGGVVFTLVVADIARASGRFNFALGLTGSAVGIGASLSTCLGGYLFDRCGGHVAFLGLAGIAAIGLAVVLCLVPETRPDRATLPA
ncbi:MAG: MFS transporter [Pseudolabrys sp.]|nr:MFS transporter [Pseudolabrys sp.]